MPNWAARLRHCHLTMMAGTATQLMSANFFARLSSVAYLEVYRICALCPRYGRTKGSISTHGSDDREKMSGATRYCVQTLQ